MQQRLLSRIRNLAVAEPQELDRLLCELDIKPDTESRQIARTLYEQILYSSSPVRTTTFHAFCQELLRRFPMEADVPPGFELVERTRHLIDEAWDLFSAELTSQPRSALANAMDSLLRKFGVQQTQALLNAFIDHRSDWWAYTLQQKDPISFAQQQLRQQFNIHSDADPLTGFFADEILQKNLGQFIELLQKHPIKKNQAAAAAIRAALDNSNPLAQRLTQLWSAFFTQKNTPLVRKAGDSQAKKMSASGEQRFLQLHAHICEQLVKLQQQIHGMETLMLSQAWYQCGASYLDYFQQIKAAQRLLDFSDLEWRCFLLLTQAEHSDWIQYKLDQRIDHLLIDEFQDTNPTQWQLILPLLEELSAANPERQRSVLFVGDSKQSIYRFRRADPQLFDTATEWLVQQLAAEQRGLHKSWRSSPAIIDFINRTFAAENNIPLTQFSEHATQHRELPGSVTLLPFIKIENETEHHPGSDILRNPLITASPNPERGYYHEGQQLAAHIRQLISGATLIGQPPRAARYSDVMILFRNRNHVGEFERALREANIPYIGTERGTLLESLEVKDMVNLLKWLLTPFDNLALAGILCSPIFSASDHELSQLAAHGNWYTRLLEIAAHAQPGSPLARAAMHLPNWLALAETLPAHDLLDRIYSEANIIARYRANFPAHLHSRVVANLIRFIELALETDSGRYPSLTRFLSWLGILRQQDHEAPDQPPGEGHDDRVRLLTIHEAKGLEAPIVFVADCSSIPRSRSGPQVLIDWPASTSRPTCFLVAPNSPYPFPYCEQIQRDIDSKNQQEENNLLYVALSRAQQHLYLSASQRYAGWYQLIAEIYGYDEETVSAAQVLEAFGTLQTAPEPVPVEVQAIADIDKRLRNPLDISPTISEIAPSHHVRASNLLLQADEDAKSRGITIHLMLQQLAQHPQLQLQEFLAQQRLAINEYQHSYWREACAVIEQFPQLYQDTNFVQAYCEVPIYYQIDERTVYGIIDRLIIHDDRMLIIDYKTHRVQNQAEINALVEQYYEQLRLYAQGIAHIRDVAVECYLLFTALPKLQAVQISH